MKVITPPKKCKRCKDRSGDVFRAKVGPSFSCEKNGWWAFWAGFMEELSDDYSCNMYATDLQDLGITTNHIISMHHWKESCFKSRNPEHIDVSRVTLPKTNISHLKIGRAPKGKHRLPTIHFQVLLLFVSGKVLASKISPTFFPGYVGKIIDSTATVDGSEKKRPRSRHVFLESSIVLKGLMYPPENGHGNG